MEQVLETTTMPLGESGADINEEDADPEYIVV
jgi:hypothetical protein